MSRSRFAFVVMVLLLAVGICGCGRQETRVKPPIVVAFDVDAGTDPKTGDNQSTIDVYSQAAGRRCITSRKLKASIVGYEAASDTWILQSNDSTYYFAGGLWKAHQGKVVPISIAPIEVTVQVVYDAASNIYTLKDDPFTTVEFPNRPQKLDRDSTQHLTSARMPADETVLDPQQTAGVLSLCFVSDGMLVVCGYNLNGTLRSKRCLKVPHRYILDCLDEVSTTRGGCVAASLVMRDTKRSELCIFDRHGRLTDDMTNGTDPIYSPDGRRLAYSDCRANWTKPGEQTVDGDAGAIIIYDPATKARKTIRAETPPGFAGLTSTLSCYRWAPDGQRLVCAFTQGEFAEESLYVVDISAAKPKWEKLPVQVYGTAWTVLRTMPPSQPK